MNLQHFSDFQRLKAAGRTDEANAALERFIASIEPGDDRQSWVRMFLESGDYGHRIRHELYEQVLFPVLLDGYRAGDGWSTFWLARTAQNLYASASLHALLQFKTEAQLLREAYQLEPHHEEVRQRLLMALLNWFRYCQHEWPTGILYGADGATTDECEEILAEVTFARTLDVDAANGPFLRQFEQQTQEYRERLRKVTCQAD